MAAGLKTAHGFLIFPTTATPLDASIETSPAPRMKLFLAVFLAGFLAIGIACAATTNPEPTPSGFSLPARGDIVDLSTIQKICEHYGLPALWAKIERDPPPLPFKSDGA